MWKDDLSKSNKAFLEIVWPRIETIVGGGEIKHVEMLQDNALAKDLDIQCGIDVWQTIAGRGCRGIASRVQFGSTDWGTFTIRSRRFSGARTELEKRIEAIETGKFIFPYLTCHAYIDNLQLVNAYVARTKDIFEAIKRNRYKTRQTTNAEFLAVMASDVDQCWSFKK